MDQIPELDTWNSEMVWRKLLRYLVIQRCEKGLLEYDPACSEIKAKNWHMGSHKTKEFLYNQGNTSV